VVLSPLLMLVAAAVWFELGRPVLFRQIRAGYLGRPFTILKFRTMAPQSDPGSLTPDGQRIGRIGHLLRSSSLDELPGLLNVLRGDMSLVGPRPLLMQYLPLYTPQQARRHVLRPGITGLAQVEGRNELSWERKFEFDIWYVDNRSFWLDIVILSRTVEMVFRRRGISHPGEATMPVFKGNRETEEL
jgi:sugar transferase EpsL